MTDCALGERCVLFFTLDSCRYDVATTARTPTLRSLGPLLRAESAGTYTLPAHTAMFNGFLPRPDNSFYPIDGRRYRAIWRSSSARPTSDAIGVPFTSGTVMDHYAAGGWHTMGASGVTFFDSGDPGHLPPTFFQEFHYFAYTGAGSPSGLRDRVDELALSHLDEFYATLHGVRTVLRFHQLCEHAHPVHNPWISADREQPSHARTALRVAPRERRYERLDAHGRRDIRASRHAAIALEWAEARLGRLFDKIRHRVPLVVVCADHEKGFGKGGRFGHAHSHPTVAQCRCGAGCSVRGFRCRASPPASASDGTCPAGVAQASPRGGPPSPRTRSGTRRLVA